MTKSKENEGHTPGPWKWDGDELLEFDDYVDFDSLRGPKGPVLVGIWHNDSTAGVAPTSLADALLIAAAPDLLDHLKSIITSYDNNELHGWEIEVARRTVQKAEGR